MMKAVILQPHYLPYQGYFEMLGEADVFVVLDSVEFSRQSWQQRNRVRLADGQVVWLTVPVHAENRTLLKDVRIDNSRPWRRKHRGTLQAAYRRSLYWDDLFWLEKVYDYEWESLTDLNILIIQTIAIELGCQPFQTVRSSEMGSMRAGRTERLIDICRWIEADVLLEPVGGTYLQGVDLGNIQVEWFKHHPKPYQQGNLEWQSHLSVVDAIAWQGTNALSPIRSAF